MRYACLAMLCSMLLSQPPAHAQEAKSALLDKLFLTPEKRQMLERQRQLDLRDEDGTESDVLRLDGIVQRSSGRHSSWINQRMRSESSRDIGVTLQPRQPTAATITLDKDKPVRLNVGEAINRDTLERKDVVDPHAIRPPPAR